MTSQSVSSQRQWELSAESLDAMARDVGLDSAAAAPVGPTPSWQTYNNWVSAGHAAGMSYLTRPDAVHKRQDPRHVLATARSVLVVAASYVGARPPELPRLHGAVSRYAWDPHSDVSGDYHTWLLERLRALISRIEDQIGRPIETKAYVDTGPILERAWAQAAGLGWIGKNGLLIHPKLGSFSFLGVALVDVQLAPGTGAMPSRCGTCTRCMDACPSGAIVSPRVVDARRCLSYLTIEHRGAIPLRHRPALGARVFGCDVCQDVCPWNSRLLARHAGTSQPALATLHLPQLLALDPQGFRARFRHTPIWRATPDGLARNAAIVLGNLGDQAARPALTRAAEHHTSEVVRESAIWALGRIQEVDGSCSFRGSLGT